MSNPICPYCYYKFSEEEVWHSDQIDPNDMCESEPYCPNCNRQFHVVAYSIIAFNSEELDE